MSLAVAVTNVSKHFANQVVLDNINLQVTSHQTLGLIGPSGAGKTTLVKIIMGMDDPDTGEVTVLGKPMPNRETLAQIGFMAQSDALYELLTGRENLTFFAELFHIAKKDIPARIEYAAGTVNLLEFLDRRVSNYSGGMKRRLSLALTLLADPDLLILDEPTVGIDPELRQQIWQELNRLRDNGKAIIITTHVMEDAAQCDNLAMIRDGHFITSGTPDELLAKYHTDSLEEVFVKAGQK
ncbi:Fe(3+)-transporting ATPase [Lentilactobacillus senioris DSM 24302 = JCM 17472]|uniref:Fe(3+)-transporting ATPase n=1 Tax=Lentilactobacillus senioris DSM 24302 = JCM 17472 TaxID=1423802 RepID=A0A0R2CS05_9LACO|nr:ABC transporter ATP-binding protein [Lentilactobacillus senioris]KRM94375.1 Fe(3+)-transporting ATPase [Lentilactobacillus senioris DSM 24302 = JCM 17472]